MQSNTRSLNRSSKARSMVVAAIVVAASFFDSSPVIAQTGGPTKSASTAPHSPETQALATPEPVSTSPADADASPYAFGSSVTVTDGQALPGPALDLSHVITADDTLGDMPVNAVPWPVLSGGDSLTVPRVSPQVVEQATDANAEHMLYLPLILAPSNPNQGPGTARINAAGRLTSENAPSVNKPTSERRLLNSDFSGTGDIRTVVCSIQDWQEADVRALTDRMMLDPNAGIIFPGAVLQGKDLERGIFTPVTVARASGKIWMEGLKLAPNAKYFKDLPELSGPAVKQAIEDILSGPVSGTAANASFDVVTTSSYEKMLFDLGVDGRYGPVSLSANLHLGNEQKKTYVIMKFTQKFYDIIFDTPPSATSVFRDGERFTDPENQVRPGNPPLYVQKVSYGRMVFFVAESDYSADDVRASLEAALNLGVASGKLKSGLTNQQVLERTRISYAVIGGDAGLALQPINTAGPQQMFDAVKAFVANKDAANFSASNPGLPIAYSLRYLSNREPARMSYSVTYGRKDCTVMLEPVADVTVNFTTVDIMDDADGWPNGKGDLCFKLQTNDQVVWYEQRWPETQKEFCNEENMEDGRSYPVNKSLTVSMNETQNLDVQARGWDNQGSSPDDLGFDKNIWAYWTGWGTLYSSDKVLHGKADGEFKMHYNVAIHWTRPPTAPSGTYLNVCRMAYTRGGDLFATCPVKILFFNFWMPRALEKFPLCKGDIAFHENVLTCPK